MAYIDGCVLAVPEKNKAAYIEHAKKMAEFLKKEGCLRAVETWGTDVPDGVNTSFPLAVKKEEGEVVCVAYYEWKSKEARDTAWEKIMKDPLMASMDFKSIFDGKRMIYGGFDVILDV